MPLAAYPRCERLGREQLATLLTIVAAAGERAWRVRSVAAAWGEIIGKVHTHGIHRAATWGGAWGCSLGVHGVSYTRRLPGQVRANPRFGKLLQRGLCRQCKPPHAPPPRLTSSPPHLHGSALMTGTAPPGTRGGVGDARVAAGARASQTAH